MAIKHYVWKLWCAWNGHEKILGTFYNVYLGRHRECLICKHCHKVFP